MHPPTRERQFPRHSLELSSDTSYHSQTTTKYYLRNTNVPRSPSGDVTLSGCTCFFPVLVQGSFESLGFGSPGLAPWTLHSVGSKSLASEPPNQGSSRSIFSPVSRIPGSPGHRQSHPSLVHGATSILISHPETWFSKKASWARPHTLFLEQARPSPL